VFAPSNSSAAFGLLPERVTALRPQVLCFLLHPCKPRIFRRLHTLLRNGAQLTPLFSGACALFWSQRGVGGINVLRRGGKQQGTRSRALPTISCDYAPAPFEKLPTASASVLYTSNTVRSLVICRTS
jgi:hypothetical protein